MLVFGLMSLGPGTQSLVLGLEQPSLDNVNKPPRQIHLCAL